MNEYYEREGFRENEGKNSWRRVIAFLKDFFKYVPDEKWNYHDHPEFFHWLLGSNEAWLLNRSVNAFSRNCSAPPRRVIKALPCLGPFKHICLWFPLNHGDHHFLYEYDAVRAYKDIIVDILTNLFPGYQIGYYFRIVYQQSGGRLPELHIHVILSTLLYSVDDRECLEKFMKLSDEERPYQSLYFLTNPIPYSTDLAALIESRWRTAIRKATGRKVTSTVPLVTVTKKDGQTILDRYHALHYVANQALHTFSKGNRSHLL